MKFDNDNGRTIEQFNLATMRAFSMQTVFRCPSDNPPSRRDQQVIFPELIFGSTLQTQVRMLERHVEL